MKVSSFSSAPKMLYEDKVKPKPLTTSLFLLADTSSSCGLGDKSVHPLYCVCEEQGTEEHKDGSQPVVPGEGIVEVHNGEDQAEELAQGHH